MLNFEQFVGLSVRHLSAMCGPERAARQLSLLVAFVFLVFAAFAATAQEGSGVRTVMQKLAVLNQYFASPTAERILASNAGEWRRPSLALVG